MKDLLVVYQMSLPDNKTVIQRKVMANTRQPKNYNDIVNAERSLMKLELEEVRVYTDIISLKLLSWQRIEGK